MFKIGQKVYSIYGDYKNLKVKNINGCKVECDGEHFKKDRFNDGVWEYGTYSLWKYELSDIPLDNSKNYHKARKWDNILNIIPNMNSSLLYIYEDYLNGELNLNPFYQRDLVWSDKQKKSYIENLFLEKASISPTIILNWANVGNGVYEVLDGKQRLTTCFDFINNKFSIFDNIYFKDLSAKDRYFIIRHDVRYTRIEKLDHDNLSDNEKIELFLEINELGTKVSQEHLDKVKEMIK